MSINLFLKPFVKNCEVLLDGSFKLLRHVSTVIQSGFYHLGQLAMVNQYLLMPLSMLLICLFPVKYTTATPSTLNWINPPCIFFGSSRNQQPAS